MNSVKPTFFPLLLTIGQPLDHLKGQWAVKYCGSGCIREMNHSIEQPGICCREDPISILYTKIQLYPFLQANYVGKIQFTLSVIVTSDGIIGHHQARQSLTRFGSIPYQDLFRSGSEPIRTYRLFNASSALASESISCMSGAIWCDQLWQESIHGPCQMNIQSGQL